MTSSRSVVTPESELKAMPPVMRRMLRSTVSAGPIGASVATAAPYPVSVSAVSRGVCGTTSPLSSRSSTSCSSGFHTSLPLPAASSLSPSRLGPLDRRALSRCGLGRPPALKAPAPKPVRGRPAAPPPRLSDARPRTLDCRLRKPRRDAGYLVQPPRAAVRNGGVVELGEALHRGGLGARAA
ncbi:hypothetical protein VTH06DRAFT_8142 [Thermothelomyces fergusii]